MRIEIKQEFLGFIGNVKFSNPDMFSAIENLLKNTDLEEKLDKFEPNKVNIFIEKLKNSIEEISDILKKDFYDTAYLIQLDFENGERSEQSYKVTANAKHLRERAIANTGEAKVQSYCKWGNSRF